MKTSPAPLWIGTTYEGNNPDYLREILPCVNYLEISPDSIATQNAGQLSIKTSILDELITVSASKQLLVHGVGLSIGSADGFSQNYIRLLDELFATLPITWHSEHLAYTMVSGQQLGTMLTLPRTDEVIDMICQRVDWIQRRYQVPFLLENVISLLPPYQTHYSEAAFLNKIVQKTGCGLILDVYNLECDAVNFGLTISEFLDELHLDAVKELHLAGGLVDDQGFQMDIHCLPTNQSTLALTYQILEKNPTNLQAITYEILDEFIPSVGTKRIVEELKRLKKLYGSSNLTAELAPAYQ